MNAKITLVAGIVSGILTVGLTTAQATPSSASSPGVRSTTAAARSAPAGATGPAVPCVKGPDGRPVDCPAPIPQSKLPAGARNTSTLTAPVTDIAQLVDTRTWTTSGGNTFPGAEAIRHDAVEPGHNA